MPVRPVPSPTKPALVAPLPAQADLADLYIVGKEITLSSVDPVTKEPIEAKVWLQKLNPVEARTASRKGGAARATILATQNDPSSEEYIQVHSLLENMDKALKVERLLVDEQARIIQVKLDEVSFEEPWKDGYLEGLQQAWNEGLEDVYSTDPDDPEAKRVWDELNKYGQQALDMAEGEIQAQKLYFEQGISDKELDGKVSKLLFKLLGEAAWFEEFQACEIWLGTRYVDDHSRPRFAKREDVDYLQKPTLDVLKAEFAELRMDPLAGKGSAVIPPS